MFGLLERPCEQRNHSSAAPSSKARVGMIPVLPLRESCVFSILGQLFQAESNVSDSFPNAYNRDPILTRDAL